MRTDNQEKLDVLLRALKGHRLVELGHPLQNGMPSGNHPEFRMTLIRHHGDVIRPGGSSASNDLIITGGHVGTHVDAISHISQDGELHGGVDARAGQRMGRHTQHGAECVPAMVRRGVLLDVTQGGEDVLPPGRTVDSRQLQDAADRVRCSPQAGDIVVIRTGWARHYTTPAKYLGEETGLPGVSEDGASWLAERGVVAAGTDTPAFEVIQPGDKHSPGPLPVHRFLIFERGIHIIEHLNLEQIAEESVGEFLLVLTPLRIVGGTGAPARPVAVLTV